MDQDGSDYRQNSSSGDEQPILLQTIAQDSGSEYNYDDESDRSVILGEDAEQNRRVNRRVRNEVTDTYAGDQSPRKRAAEDNPAERPFKRQRSQLNPEYLDLLNRDIDDAAHRVCLEDDVALPGSQLGLTYWSPLEKKQFFEALSRLGKHDLQGIASRIGTKGPVEVKHYLRILHEATTARLSQSRRSIPGTAEYPAAVELTPQCCHAQEEAADEVSIRQEIRENEREEEKWQEYWDITPETADDLDKALQDDAEMGNITFAKLFHVTKWLELSDRMFMNSSIPGSNWRNIDSQPPSIWATSLQDFHSLALSITRRLVQTTLFISMSRIRAKSELEPGTRRVVRKKDVEAAIASLGLSPNRDDLWVKSARRLRLDVYENPPDSIPDEFDSYDEDVDEEPMTYDEVEVELSGRELPRASSVDSTMETLKLESLSSDSGEADEEDSGEDSDGQRPAKDEEQRSLNREANEVLWYSAVGIQDLHAPRRALELRIEADRQQERHADAMDGYASYAAEVAMWTLLQKAPPMEMPRKQNPERVPRKGSNMHVEDLYAMNRTWADDIEYHAEWETLAKPFETVADDGQDDDN